MPARRFSSKPRVRVASSDGLEPVIVVLPDGSIRLFSQDDQPLAAQTVLSEFPSMSLASLDCLVSPSASLVPGETYFLAPRRASAREEAALIRLATPASPAAWPGASAFRAPASLPPRSPPAVSDGEIPLTQGDAAGGWAYRHNIDASVANMTFPTTAATTTTTIESSQASWSIASSSAAESPSCAGGSSSQSGEETLETCFAAQGSFGSGRGSSFGSGRAGGGGGGDDEEPFDSESEWSRRDRLDATSGDGRCAEMMGDALPADSEARVLFKSRTYNGTGRSSGDYAKLGLQAVEGPSRSHVAPSPPATANAILAELAALEEQHPAEDDACYSNPATATTATTSPGPPPAPAETASLKARVLAALARFNLRNLRRAASSSTSSSSGSKRAMAAAAAAAPPTGGRGEGAVARRGLISHDADHPAAAAFVSSRAVPLMCGDAESAEGWADVDGLVLMMTDTRIRHRAPPGRRTAGVGRQGGFAQQERGAGGSAWEQGAWERGAREQASWEQGAAWEQGASWEQGGASWEPPPQITWGEPGTSQLASFFTRPGQVGINSSASRQLQRTPSLTAEYGRCNGLMIDECCCCPCGPCGPCEEGLQVECCDGWQSLSDLLVPETVTRRGVQVRLSESALRQPSSYAVERNAAGSNEVGSNEYSMPPSSQRFLSGPLLLQATY
ncbi:hypothetical protein CLOM_g16669 [Closterium sp. NIES-68]|nr:hypothetical protein CLOM_g16669 [Closterium sp. NIES-68]GJP82784.1 hypothetical protein CLOP_g13018 [Closterium sp. NIES-67]